MNSLELDHVFCFCSPELPEATLAEKSGFKVSSGKSHPGQGTANRCILFQKNYLEFIYLSSKSESEGNPLQLHRRASWRETGASPFGIALRGSLSDASKSQFWEYRPSYAQGKTILIHKQAGDNYPLIFISPSIGDSVSTMWPSRRPNIDGSLLEHPVGAQNMILLHVVGPGYHWPLSESVPNIQFGNSEAPHMKVILEGPSKTQISFNELVSVLIQ